MRRFGGGGLERRTLLCLLPLFPPGSWVRWPNKFQLFVHLFIHLFSGIVKGDGFEFWIFLRECPDHGHDGFIDFSQLALSRNGWRNAGHPLPLSLWHTLKGTRPTGCYAMLRDPEPGQNPWLNACGKGVMNGKNWIERSKNIRQANFVPVLLKCPNSCLKARTKRRFRHKIRTIEIRQFNTTKKS